MAQKMKHTTGERSNIRFNGKIKLELHAARSISNIYTIGRFETEILILKKNLKGLSEINGSWVENAMRKTTHHRIIREELKDCKTK